MDGDEDYSGFFPQSQQYSPKNQHFPQNSQSPKQNSEGPSSVHSDAAGGDMSYMMIDYIKECMKAMDMMRGHHMLTDVILEVNNQKFHAHRVILSAASPYFKAMFTGGLKECEMHQVKLQGLSATAMSKLINFIYTGRIRVTENTVCQLLPAATMLQVPQVIQKCCEFLEKQLDPSNAIGIANFAEQHGCLDLHKKSQLYLEANFSLINQEDEFLQLNDQQLVNLIKKDTLNVQDEKEVYNSVLKWVKFDERQRHQKMECILSAVRCQFLPPKFLTEQLSNCEVIRKQPACKEYLARIFKDLTLHIRTVVKERQPNIPRLIYIAGGYHKKSLNLLEGFNVDEKKWYTLDRMTVSRSGLGGAFLKGTFYAVGGRNNCPQSLPSNVQGHASGQNPLAHTSYDSDWVDKYNPIKNQWRPCSPMSRPRNRVGVAVLDGLLYAVGGSDCDKYHDSAECYDPEVDRWTMLQPMRYKRLALGVAVVNRLLYAIGGFDGVERHRSAECYHPENDEWTMIEPMHFQRSGAGCCALNQNIYVLGGYDGRRQLSSVERYDTVERVWTVCAPMRLPRSALSCTVLDGRIYALGGYDGERFLDAVEIYDPVEDSWVDGVPLTSGRSGHASAVCYSRPCTAVPHCTTATTNDVT